MTPAPPPSADSVAGIDVGKYGLDVFVDPSKLERRFANTPDGRRTLRDWLRELRARRVAVEPTGRYHRALHQCLCDDGVKVVLANPQRMRNFARSLGEQAKSDRIDAAMLARYAHLDDTPPRPVTRPPACSLTCWKPLTPRSRRPTTPLRSASRPTPPYADAARSSAPSRAAAR